MDSAAANGHANVLPYLHTHWRSVGCTPWGVECAAGNGHYSIVAWLAEHKQLQCYEAKFALLRAAGTHRQRLFNVFFLFFPHFSCYESAISAYYAICVKV
jgi:hypothetical protein